jgi:hypothetical protein
VWIVSCFVHGSMAVRACQRPKSRRKGNGNVPRSCRAYRQRTVDVLRRAAASWQAISGQELPPPPEGGDDCPGLARATKEWLGKHVSDDESLQMGFQSIKKLLPDSCRCMESGMLSSLVERLGRPPRVLPPGYLSFVKRETARLFPKGWDASYERFCLSTSPPLSACIESGRAAGGALSVLTGGQADYLDRVLHGKGGKLCPRYAGKLLVVQSAGKPRPLSKFPAESLFLKPLHKTIYGNLSKRNWLLRGPPSQEVLRRAGFSAEKGVLVSGDYRSATDNLPIEVMECALRVMLANACSVPPNVRELAERACRPILFSEEESLEVRVGQMMGSLLSFPFLCLQNYLAFRWAVRSAGGRGQVPVLINGDDILFQTADPEFPDQWFGTVAAVGLEVEETKTSVEPLWGTINSTLLRWEGTALKPVWSPRFGMLRPAEHPGSLGRSFLDFLKGAPTEYRYRSGRVWFDWHVGELRQAGVSLPTLGFRGLLAKRLAEKFHLQHFTGENFPSFYHRHGVRMTADFVTRVPETALSEEERFHSSVEVAAAKWNEGYAPVVESREAILYCLDRTAVKSDRHDYSFMAWPFYVGSEEWRFRTRNGSESRGRSRREVAKSYLAPFPVPEEVLVATSVVEWLSPDLGRGTLPPYRETPGPECLGTVVDVCCG